MRARLDAALVAAGAPGAAHDARTDEQRRYGVVLAPPRIDPGTVIPAANAAEYVTDEHRRYGATEVIPSAIAATTADGPIVPEGDLTEEHIRYGITQVGVRSANHRTEEHDRYGAVNVK